MIVFYKQLDHIDEAKVEGDGDHEPNGRRTMFARPSWVFNAAQVDGWDPPQDGIAPNTSFDRLAAIEQVIVASGADIRYGGSRAFYHRGDDYIQVPNPGDFVGSPTSTPLECFHSVQLHELSHWAGAERRLNREKGKRFADRAYAFEEMVAQLSAAFLCAELGVSNDSRPDDAQYIAGFLDVLHNDKKAIFAAAAAASAAADYILSFSNRGQAARVA